MQKRYAELADRIGEVPGSADGVAGRAVPRGDLVSSATKTFHRAQRFEYQRIDHAPGDPLMGEPELNVMGAEGWELTGLVSGSSGTHYYFKRARSTAAMG